MLATILLALIACTITEPSPTPMFAWDYTGECREGVHFCAEYSWDGGVTWREGRCYWATLKYVLVPDPVPYHEEVWHCPGVDYDVPFSKLAELPISATLVQVKVNACNDTACSEFSNVVEFCAPL
jgi:hypothetical protein